MLLTVYIVFCLQRYKVDMIAQIQDKDFRGKTCLYSMTQVHVHACTLVNLYTTLVVNSLWHHPTGLELNCF